MEIGPQNHSRGGLLGPGSMIVVYMDPLGELRVQTPRQDPRSSSYLAARISSRSAVPVCHRSCLPFLIGFRVKGLRVVVCPCFNQGPWFSATPKVSEARVSKVGEFWFAYAGYPL